MRPIKLKIVEAQNREIRFRCQGRRRQNMRPSIKVKISLQLISMKCQFLCRRRRRRCRRQQMIGL